MIRTGIVHKEIVQQWHVNIGSGGQKKVSLVVSCE
jgi:hypothetical protein